MAIVAAGMAAAESRARLVAEPSVTTSQLEDAVDKFMALRGTNDLMTMVGDLRGIHWNTAASKSIGAIARLHPLWDNLLVVCTNGIPPFNAFPHILQGPHTSAKKSATMSS